MSPTTTSGIPLYRKIAREISRHDSKLDRVAVIAKSEIAKIEANHLPSGSGVDSGTKINIEKSTPERVVLDVSFHHTNDSGFYTGWTHHMVIITPSLQWEFNIRITGRDKNGIKDYLCDLFQHALSSEVEA